MTLTKSKIFIAMAAIIAVMAFASFTLANPISFIYPIAATAATTTPAAYLTATGQATSTTLDAYHTTSNNTTTGFATNYLMVQNAASSTSSNLNIRFQYSTDNIDWYDDGFVSQATTTPGVVDIRGITSYNWLASGTATSSKIIAVPTPVRYVRAVFTETGAAAAIWYQWAPTKQTP